MTRDFKSFDDLARHFDAVARRLPSAEKRMLQGVGERVTVYAILELGFYQQAVGPFPAWAPLAESTKEKRSQAGYPADEPLLVTGQLERSIGYVIHGNEVTVGSPLDYAAYLEWGTSRAPPRPFLGPAMIVTEKSNREAMATEIATTFRRTR